MDGVSGLDTVFRDGLVVFPSTISSLRHAIRADIYSPIELRRAYMALPPKINRCCAGGIPAFSSTLSFTLLICVSAVQLTYRSRRASTCDKSNTTHMPVWLDVDLDLQISYLPQPSMMRSTST